MGGWNLSEVEREQIQEALDQIVSVESGPTLSAVTNRMVAQETMVTVV